MEIHWGWRRESQLLELRKNVLPGFRGAGGIQNDVRPGIDLHQSSSSVKVTSKDAFKLEGKRCKTCFICWAVRLLNSILAVSNVVSGVMPHFSKQPDKLIPVLGSSVDRLVTGFAPGVVGIGVGVGAAPPGG
jgi:hypothetical protein